MTGGSRTIRSMRRRAPPDDSATLPNARPPMDGEPDAPAEDVFASFLQHAYARKEGRTSRASTTMEWERSIEELLPQEREPRDERDTEPPPPRVKSADSTAPNDALPVVRAPAPKADADSTLRVVLLTRKKTLPPGYASPPDDGEAADATEATDVATAVAHADELRAAVRASRPEVKPPARPSDPPRRASSPSPSPEWSSVIPPPSEATQRREAKKLVPDLAAQKPKPKPAREASEDGLIPSGELDGKLGDLAVLVRYGHESQVARELDGLRRNYPQDLLLLRRIGEFWSESGRKERALETLFALATGLFERRNVEGMRQALEQAKALDPNSERANRLLALLDARPDGQPKK